MEPIISGMDQEKIHREIAEGKVLEALREDLDSESACSSGSTET
jgi:hypothetical protein